LPGTTHRHGEQVCGFSRGRGEEEGRIENLGLARCKLLYIEWINKFFLYSIGNCIQYPMINIMEKNI